MYFIRSISASSVPPILAKAICSLYAIFILCMPVVAQETQAPETQIYTLSPGDVIAISVYDEPEMSIAVRLSETGGISYPFVGEVEVLGRTTSEVAAAIKESLISGEYFVQPEVNVNITQYRPYYIDGQVAGSGSYPFEPGLTLRKAISIAGGFTERASRSNITILRDSEEFVPVGEILDTPIRPDDIITVAERFF